MKEKELITIRIMVPKSKVKKIKAFLEKEGATVEIVGTELPHGARRGNYKKGEKPSQFAGAWADREEDSNDDLRKKAWNNRGVK